MFNDRLTFEEAMLLGFDLNIGDEYAAWDEDSQSIIYPKYVIVDEHKVRLT